MKTLIPIVLFTILITGCKKNAYKCTCKTYGVFTTASQSEYTITDTERKARKKCESGSTKSKGYISLSGTTCELR